jgi:acyl-CoA synthetase (AMP-forming)/AMP-acid ligase II
MARSFFAAGSAIVVPFNTWSTRRELDFLLSDSKVRVFAIPALGSGFAEDIAALRSSAGHRNWRRSSHRRAPTEG